MPLNITVQLLDIKILHVSRKKIWFNNNKCIECRENLTCHQRNNTTRSSMFELQISLFVREF